MIRRPTSRLLRHLVAVVLLAACGDRTPGPAVPIESTTFAPSLGVDLAASRRTPSGMYVRDLGEGSGTPLAAGQTVEMRYVGSFASGKVFDSNPAPKPTFKFKLGGGQVIAGWDEGLVGMKVGGRRQLVIPASLAYGPDDYGPIPGNSVLVFTVEAIGAR
ncbi:MAG: FKBP-type peptidyl-prolyl cis-trans isomerase [Gemmatimonadetes bacterium]|nr:FKBP-type peptidyl-prolyl cis-trans isomerase [Gemmatimonadota bacterium]